VELDIFYSSCWFKAENLIFDTNILSWATEVCMTSDFILIIIVTFGFGDDSRTFQLNFPKASQAECMVDAEKIEQQLPFISIETKCEPTSAFPSNENEGSVST
jgi:hypothetical protein